MIFDTDWWTDADDAVAVRLLFHAERVGLIDVQAIIIDTWLTKGPGALSALAAFEGHPDILIGVHNYVPSGSPAYQATMFDTRPHKAGYPSTLLNAVDAYRNVLHAADDGSIEIIAVGYETALAALLASAADSIDSRTGAELVAAKVSKLWVMGGWWPRGSENNFTKDATASAAASAVVAGWPTPIVFAGWDVGATVLTGGNLVGTHSADPLAQALVDYGATGGRSTWDGMAVWVAALNDLTAAGYTAVTGTASVNASTGANSFTPGAGTHSYLVKTKPDLWYQRDLNSRLIPGVDPSPTPGEVAVLHEPETPLYVRPARNTEAGLLHQWHADDLADLGGSGLVSHWDDRTGRAPARQHTSGSRPSAGTVGSKAALVFASGKYLGTDTVTLPATVTVYARVWYDSLPGSTQTIIAADISGSATKSFHLSVASGGVPTAIRYDESGASRVDTCAAIGSTGAWVTLTMRYNATQVEALLDGVSNGVTTAGTTQSVVPHPLGIGSRYATSSSEPFVGSVREIRIYDSWHDDTKVTSVLAEMSA